MVTNRHLDLIADGEHVWCPALSDSFGIGRLAHISAVARAGSTGFRPLVGENMWAERV